VQIAQTGATFSPQGWMDATLSAHRSPEAATTLPQFLAAHPELPQRLRWVVLSASADLFRAAGRVGKP